MEAFARCQKDHPQLCHDRDIVEDFAMQILMDGISHPSVTVRAMTMLSIGFARDFRLVPLILSGLRDDSELVRTLALHAIPNYGLQHFKESLCEIARYDGAMSIRILAYQLAAMFDVQELLPYLRSCAQDRCIEGEERREAWKVVVSLDPEYARKYQVEDVGHAILSHALLPLTHEEQERILTSLLRDPSIQDAALRSLLMCGRAVSCSSQVIRDQVSHLAQTSLLPKISLQAAAILYLQGDRLGEQKLIEGLLSPYPSVCEAASEAVCSLGIKGGELASRYLSHVCARRAAVNLSIVLLTSRRDIERAGDVLSTFILDPEMCWGVENILWDAPYQSYDLSAQPLYVHMIRGEIARKLIRLLALAKYSKTHQVVREFLAGKQQQGWSFFSGLFWEEGDAESSESLQGDEDFASRLESALSILSQHKSHAALKHVLTLYPDSRWQDKLAILETIAYAENLDALPFLLTCCTQETPTLRSAAAGVLFALFK